MALTKLLLVACLAICVLSQDPYERAKALLAKMTLQEKIHMVTGVDFGKPYQGNVRALPHLNIPALTLEDGPQGVADGIKDVTCFPSVLTATATWYDFCI
jgi:beta-glucosidase